MTLYSSTRYEKFSLVIPTWNEERWLPGLLARAQKIIPPSQTIIADNNSRDATVAIAKGHGCTVVPGGKPGAGRNAGAAATASDYIAFADADAVFYDDLFRIAVEEFQENPRTVAIHFPLRPLNANFFMATCYKVLDAYFTLCSAIGRPQGVGTFLVVRRWAFEQAGGFDCGVAVGEDTDFIQRISRLGAVHYCREREVGTSARRFRLEHGCIFVAKTAMWGALRFIGLRSSARAYTWRVYPSQLAWADQVEFDKFFEKNNGG